MGVVNYGIDVSSNNGPINWPQVKLASSPPILWAYIKTSEGYTYHDKLALQNAQGAQSAGVPFGFYHFAHLKNADVLSDATGQASFFVSILKGMPEAALIPVLDIEVNEAGLSGEAVVEFIQTFLGVMADNGFDQVMIYSGLYWLNSNLPDNHPLGNIPLWIAEYNSALYPTLPKGWNTYSIWQYTDSGLAPGVTGKVDMSKSSPDLVALAKVGGIGLAVAGLATGLFFLAYEYFSHHKSNS